MFRALQLGDLLCVVPALRALRAAAPRADHADRSAVGRKFRRALTAYTSTIPGVSRLSRLAGAARAIACDAAFSCRGAARRFDLAIQLHGSGALSNPLMVLLGAGRTAGFYQPGQYCPDPERFIAWDESNMRCGAICG